MSKISKYKSGLGAFISSEKGQRFFNFAYSIGAAIVIWGALFKILHLPGGNMLLSIGMGTEVLMFVLTAFDRPPREYHWEEVFPALQKKAEEEGDEVDADAEAAMLQATGQAGQGGGTIIIGGGYSGTPSPAPASGAAAAPQAVVTNPATGLPELNVQLLTESIEKMATAADQLSRISEMTAATQRFLDQTAAMAAEMAHLQSTTRTLNDVSKILLQSFSSITENSETINESARGYVERMKALDQNVAGLNTIYEIQLKSVSSQLDSIDRVNRGIKDIRDMYEKGAAQSARYCEEGERMTRYMQQINNVYEKMLSAMTVNMYRPMMPGQTDENPNL